jgi:ABC-type phosphate/phosphonate transport system permease subunit
MGKLWSEAMDEVDPGPADALRVSGARESQVIANAVLPAVVPAMVACCSTASTSTSALRSCWVWWARAAWVS